MYKFSSPKKADMQVKFAIEKLGLLEADIKLLKLFPLVDFEPELDCCHLNVWVQCLQKGGGAQHGWLIYQDKSQQILVAVFHSVWRAPDGVLFDISPREFGDKRVLFVCDNSRQIVLKKQGGLQIIDTFDNLQLLGRAVIQHVSPKLIAPQSDMITKYGLGLNW